MSTCQSNSTDNDPSSSSDFRFHLSEDGQQRRDNDDDGEDVKGGKETSSFYQSCFHHYGFLPTILPLRCLPWVTTNLEKTVAANLSFLTSVE